MPHNPDHCTPLKYQYVSNVTLACEDIEHFEEHKVMLAVWDSIFQNWENTRHPLARHHLSQKPVNFYSEHSLEEFSKVWRVGAPLPGSTLHLPQLTKLQEVVDDLRTCEMDSKAAEEAKVEFMDYIQSTWIDGQFSPEMWSCFGRKSDHTNNCQEAYNAVLNRSLFVCFWQTHFTRC